MRNQPKVLSYKRSEFLYKFSQFKKAVEKIVVRKSCVVFLFLQTRIVGTERLLSIVGESSFRNFE